MKKLYAFLTWMLFVLVSHQSIAQNLTQDLVDFSFTVDADNNNVSFINASVIGQEPGDRKAVWSFGDGSSQTTGPLENTQHHYAIAGTYTVCLKILRYRSATSDTVSAYLCKEITIPMRCSIDFEKVSVSANSSLTVGFKPLLWNNAYKKPKTICWYFGDGKDTCINYGEDYIGTYGVYHHYNNAGTYQPCVSVLYYGGCEAKKCGSIIVEPPTTCSADFERLPLTTTNSPLYAAFKALPWNSDNKKPARICWYFGDNRDTCIGYGQDYTGPYTIAHHYNQGGVYEVCVKILYYGYCEAKNCKAVTIEKPDSCSADFEQIEANTTSPWIVYYKALPWNNNNKKPRTICWRFGDGRDTCINYTDSYTGVYAVRHEYQRLGQYEVCVKILYYGGCEAYKCKLVQIGKPDECKADFERLPVIDVNDPFKVAFKALTWNSNNRKPKTICWYFGDGRDTCINYSENYNESYVVRHRYNHSGIYQVCIKILYYGGCEAGNCKEIKVGNPATCTADFERTPVIANIPLYVGFKAILWNSQNHKPAKICWYFGDGRDTCITYSQDYSGYYVAAHRYEHAGQYQVCVTIVYYGGCEAKKCKDIQIGPVATCTADFERAPLQDNNPLTIALKALPQNSQDRKPARICWTFGDGRDTCINYGEDYSGHYIVNHRYEHTGKYEVCIKIFYYGGCEAKKCKDIVLPGECHVRLFEITPSITSLVRGFYASVSSYPQSYVEKICWLFGDGDDTCIMIPPTMQPGTTQLTIRHTYPGPGVYRACVKVRFAGGCEAYDCREVVIRPLSDICGGFMVDSLAGPKTYKFTGHSINRPNDEVMGYHWTFGDGSSASGQEVTHTYATGGDFEVCLYIKTRLGCETRICKLVRVPGNNEPQLQLAPNPVLTTVTVNFRSTHTETINIRIVNSNGVPVRSYTRSVTVGLNTWTHDLSSLLTGVYSYNIQSANQQASVIFLKN